MTRNNDITPLLLLVFGAIMLLAFCAGSGIYHYIDQNNKWNDNLQSVINVKIYSNGEVNTFTGYNRISRNSNGHFYLDYDDRTIVFSGDASIENNSLLVMGMCAYQTEWK